MFGNILNNTQLIDLVARRLIRIDQFDAKKIATFHYPLMPRNIYEITGRKPDGQVEVSRVHSVSEDSKFYAFKPRQYLLIQIEEHIDIPEGIVAQFVSPYQLIEKGFMLNAGRMESPFGKQGNRLVFGLSNMLSKENAFSYTDPVAYVYFYDLRGLNNTDFGFSPDEMRKFSEFARRFARANNDGPNYESDLE